MFRTGIALFAVIAAIAVLGADEKPKPKKSSDVVKITATAGKIEDDKQTVTVTIEMTKPWHIYANPVDNVDIASAATLVDITGEKKPASVKVHYPAGKVEKDSTLGDYKIYEGKVEIKVDVVRAKGDTGNLKASIKLQACWVNEKGGGACLLPDTVEVDVK
jgi:hypothetical protein